MFRFGLSRIIALCLAILWIAESHALAGDLYKLVQDSFTSAANAKINDFGQVPCITTSDTLGYWQDGKVYPCGNVAFQSYQIFDEINNASSGNMFLYDQHYLTNYPNTGVPPFLLSKTGGVTYLYSTTSNTLYTSGYGLNDAGKAVGNISYWSSAVKEPFYYDGTFH